MASLYFSVVVSVERRRESCDITVWCFGMLVLMRIIQWVGIMLIGIRRILSCRDGPGECVR